MACNLGGAAAAAPPGTLIITDRRLEAGGDYASFEKEVKAAATSKLAKSGEGWHVYFVAYLKRAPGSEAVNIVFYDAGTKSREPVHFYELRTKPTAKIPVSDVEIKPEDGFKAGAKYSVLITRLISGREEIYARTTLELSN